MTVVVPSYVLFAAVAVIANGRAVISAVVVAVVAVSV